jgi:CRISPR system Cascade subunit CasB
MTTESETRTRWYWEGFDPAGPHAGADLAVLRKGVGRRVGDVWEMARFYRSLSADGETTPRLRAEHAALALFAVHQQSQPASMHRAGTQLGAAARALHTGDAAVGGKRAGEPSGGRYSEDAVSRRMNQIATATDTTELVAHLRGLVTLLRTIKQPLDYTQLRLDIERWHYPDSRAGIRARWGRHFFTWPTPANGSK